MGARVGRNGGGWGRTALHKFPTLRYKALPPYSDADINMLRHINTANDTDKTYRDRHRNRELYAGNDIESDAESDDDSKSTGGQGEGVGVVVGDRVGVGAGVGGGIGVRLRFRLGFGL